MWLLRQTNEQGNSFHDGSTEIFKSGHWAYLSRELIQNSIDAIDNPGTELKMVFELDDMRIDEIVAFRNISDHIRGTLSINKLPDNCRAFSENALRLLSNDTIRILKISDFNTTGVLGSENIFEMDSQWKALVYDEGNSQKSSSIAAGSFGLGKNAPFGVSSIYTVFYVTQDKFGAYAFEGVAKLNTSVIDGQNFERKVYYAKDSNGKAVPYSRDDKSSLSPRFDRNSPGTDIYIMGVDFDGEEIKKEVIKSILENFFIRIINAKLRVTVMGVEISKETIEDLMNLYGSEQGDYTSTNLKYGYGKQYINAFRNGSQFEETIDGIGKLKLYLSKDEGIAGKYVAMFRTHGMKIYDYNVRVAEQPVSGVFLPGDEQVDTFLRSIENPTHDAFDPQTRIPNKTLKDEAQKKLTKITMWIREKVREFTKIQTTDQLELKGMENYVSFLSDKIDERVRTLPSIEVKENQKSARANPYRITKVEKTKPDDSTGFGGQDKKKEGKKPNKKGGKKHSDDGKKGLEIETIRYFKVPPRIVVTGDAAKIKLNLDVEWDKFNIWLKSVGEDNNESDLGVKILKATNHQKNIELRHDSCRILDVEKDDQLITLQFDKTLESKIKLIIYREVKANENQS